MSMSYPRSMLGREARCRTARLHARACATSAVDISSVAQYERVAIEVGHPRMTRELPGEELPVQQASAHEATGRRPAWLLFPGIEPWRTHRATRLGRAVERRCISAALIAMRYTRSKCGLTAKRREVTVTLQKVSWSSRAHLGAGETAARRRRAHDIVPRSPRRRIVPRRGCAARVSSLGPRWDDHASPNILALDCRLHFAASSGVRSVMPWSRARGRHFFKRPLGAARL